MPEPCPNPWYFGGCEPTIEYLWRWTDSWERWVIYTQAVLLAYVIVVAARVAYRYYSARRAEPVDHASEEFSRERRKLIAELIPKVSGLKSVAVAAPYLGSAGVLFGILGGFTAFSGSLRRFVEWTKVVGAMALMSTSAGILVALLATFFYNFFRTRIELLRTEIDRKRGSRTAQTLPLAPRISKFPFALTAAPLLALYIMAFLTIASFNAVTGLAIGLAPNRCASDTYERVIVLHVTDANKIFLNTEEEADQKQLAERLSDIYKMRNERVLYLLADDDVAVQTVANAIDAVRSLSLAPGSLDIKVELITPAAMQAACSGLHSGAP